ncbi:MAG: BMC domain-containing protein, partial [Clostridiaceae bacterium]|nr:BMC domain-containing protein [Clostridiaceae bacterium]
MKALGLIETIGMVTAIQAADICLKSSNVRLIGYEIIAGALVTIKIEGDVGAVKAAIDAAKISIEISNKLVSTLV